MGIFAGLLGTASEADVEQVEQEIMQILAADEHVEKAYKLIRDLTVLTSKRIILIDKQGMSGKKTEYTSIPYRAIVKYSIESAGHFDLDSEVKLWLSGHSAPISLEFRKTKDITDIIQIITKYAC